MSWKDKFLHRINHSKTELYKFGVGVEISRIFSSCEVRVKIRVECRFTCRCWSRKKTRSHIFLQFKGIDPKKNFFVYWLISLKFGTYFLFTNFNHWLKITQKMPILHVWSEKKTEPKTKNRGLELCSECCKDSKTVCFCCSTHGWWLLFF